MPVKAIFNLKTEDMVAALDDDGNPVYELGENKTKRLVKRAKTLEKPILASKVFFDDGSWTVVKNSGEDTVDVEEKKLSDGAPINAGYMVLEPQVFDLLDGDTDKVNEEITKFREDIDKLKEEK